MGKHVGLNVRILGDRNSGTTDPPQNQRQVAKKARQLPKLGPCVFFQKPFQDTVLQASMHLRHAKVR